MYYPEPTNKSVFYFSVFVSGVFETLYQPQALLRRNNYSPFRLQKEERKEGFR